MRLIDADKLSNNMIIVVEKANEDVIKSISELLGKIKNAPTIDAVQVVRCKDCKHRWPDLDEGKMICLIDRSRRADDEEWFCADGKRKVAESE